MMKRCLSVPALCLLWTITAWGCARQGVVSLTEIVPPQEFAAREQTSGCVVDGVCVSVGDWQEPQWQWSTKVPQRTIQIQVKRVVSGASVNSPVTLLESQSQVDAAADAASLETSFFVPGRSYRLFFPGNKGDSLKNAQAGNLHDFEQYLQDAFTSGTSKPVPSVDSN